jgi:aryl-alcohol dehydrogenase-like predicted oxidoreductase
MTVDRLVLGTAQFGMEYGISNINSKPGLDEVETILDFSRTSGINTLDTAISYGDSEQNLGNTGVNGFKIVTKLPSLPDNSTDHTRWLNEQLNSSLTRLGVDQIHGLLVHNPQQLLGPHGHKIVNFLEKVKKSGIVENIGISIYSSVDLDMLEGVLNYDIVQAPFNLIDQDILDSGWLHKLSENNIEIHARSIFLQGLLLMNQDVIPDKFAKWSELFKQWNNWIKEESISPVQACISFVLAFKEINKLVIGVQNCNQLTQIVDAFNNPITMEFPSIKSDDQSLINPSNWINL